MALLFATYIIRSKWEYRRVPKVYRDDVDAILKEEGYEDLINAN